MPFFDESFIEIKDRGWNLNTFTSETKEAHGKADSLPCLICLKFDKNMDISLVLEFQQSRTIDINICKHLAIQIIVYIWVFIFLY